MYFFLFAFRDKDSLTSACTNSATRVHAFTVETPLLPLARMRFTTSCITWPGNVKNASTPGLSGCRYSTQAGQNSAITAGQYPTAVPSLPFPCIVMRHTTAGRKKSSTNNQKNIS